MLKYFFARTLLNVKKLDIRGQYAKASNDIAIWLSAVFNLSNVDPIRILMKPSYQGAQLKFA